MDKYTFGNKLYGLRTNRGLTQKQLAKYLGVSDKAVSKWETGEAMPRVKTLQAIADCFGITYSALLSDEAVPQSMPPYELYYKKRLEKYARDFVDSQLYLNIALVMLVIFKVLSIFFSGLHSRHEIAYSIISVLSVIVVLLLYHKIMSSIIKNSDSIAKKHCKPILVLSIPFILIGVLDAVVFFSNPIVKIYTILCHFLAFVYVFALIYAFILKKNIKLKKVCESLSVGVVFIFYFTFIACVVAGAGGVIEISFISSVGFYWITVANAIYIVMINEMKDPESGDFEETKNIMIKTFCISSMIATFIMFGLNLFLELM